MIALVRPLEARLRAVERALAAAQARPAALAAERARRGGPPKSPPTSSPPPRKREPSAGAQDCQTLFRLALHRAHPRDGGELGGAAYTAAGRKSEAAGDALLAPSVAGAEASRRGVRCREHRASRFGCLDDAAVPPTNHAAEQALRHSLVHRKGPGGFRSDGGADAQAIVTTGLDTARKHGDDRLATLHAARGQPATMPAGLPLISPGR